MSRRFEEVILVDEGDREIGTEEKLTAHKKGLLHRAFSTYVFNDDGEILLQRRALTKYHSAGLWTNACCSHPRPGESVIDAAKRRMPEEMGVDVEIQPAFTFQYKADLVGSLIEHEIDHVLIGTIKAEPQPNQTEVDDWRWVRPEIIEQEMAESPDDFTVWFALSFERVVQFVKGAGLQLS